MDPRWAASHRTWWRRSIEGGVRERGRRGSLDGEGVEEKIEERREKREGKEAQEGGEEAKIRGSDDRLSGWPVSQSSPVTFLFGDFGFPLLIRQKPRVAFVFSAFLEKGSDFGGDLSSSQPVTCSLQLALSTFYFLLSTFSFSISTCSLLSLVSSKIFMQLLQLLHLSNSLPLLSPW